MQPSPTQSTRDLYQRYKADNEFITAWLGHTALEHGYPLEHVSSNTSPYAAGSTTSGTQSDLSDSPHKDVGGKTAKQLRKARKRSKQKANKKLYMGQAIGGGSHHHEDTAGEGRRSSSSAALNTRFHPAMTHTITVQDHIKLAEYLVQRDALVPLTILRRLARCIRLRKRSAAGYEQDPANSSDGHTYIISALERVFVLLSEHRLAHISLGVVQSEAGDVSRGEDGSYNRFLELSDTEAIPTGDEHDASTGDLGLRWNFERVGETGDGNAIIYRMQPSQIGLVDSARKFIQQVSVVRAYLRNMWQLYKRGKVDLVRAGLISNTALELLVVAHRDFATLLDSATRPFRGDLRLTMIFVRLVTDGMARSAGAGDLGTSEREADYALHTRLLLERIQLLSQVGKGIDLEGGHFDDMAMPIRDRASDLGFERSWDEWRAGQAILREHVMLAMQVRLERAADPSRTLPCDAFFSIIGEYIDNGGKASLIAAAGLQICMDAHFELGDDRQRCVDDLRVRVLSLQQSVEQHVVPVYCCEDCSHPLRDQHEEHKAYLTNALKPLHASVSGLDDVERDLRALSPITCGRLLATVILRFRHVGLSLLEHHSLLNGAAHVYSIVTAASGGQLPIWRDLEFAIDVCGFDWRAGRPTSTVSASDISFKWLEGSFRAQLHETMDRAERSSGRPSPAHHLPQQWTVRDNWSTDLKRLTNVLQRGLVVSPATHTKDIHAYLSRLAQEFKVGSNAAGRAGGRHGKRHSFHSARGTLVLLDVMQVALEAETVSFHFDYTAMANRLWRLGQTTGAALANLGLMSSTRPDIDIFLPVNVPLKLFPIARGLEREGHLPDYFCRQDDHWIETTRARAASYSWPSYGALYGVAANEVRKIIEYEGDFELDRVHGMGELQPALELLQSDGKAEEGSQDKLLFNKWKFEVAEPGKHRLCRRGLDLYVSFIQRKMGFFAHVDDVSDAT